MRKYLVLCFTLLVALSLININNHSVQGVVSLQATPDAEPASEPVPADAPYKDPTTPLEDRVRDLLQRMTLSEKIGQITLVEKGSIKTEDIAGQYIGALLSGGGGYPPVNTPEGWREMVTFFQSEALKTRLAIPLIYGVDAVHGHNNVRGTVIFPHNIGLGATRNAELVEKIGQITAKEMLATGILWNYAPVIAVPQDIRWGRTYEGYSENTALVTELGTAYLHGLQGDILSDPASVLGTPKHFIGDGGTKFGSSTTPNYLLDQGVMDVDEATLRELYLPPYAEVVKNGAMSIMVSFSSWKDTKMHAQKYLVTDVLKGELGFNGFIVSDWQAIDQIPGDYYSDVVTSINAGIDMNMVPYDYVSFITALTRAVESGDVPIERIDDAVTRILRVKFALGLFERPLGDSSLLSLVGSDEHRAIARQAVSESLVLLQNNDGTLPLSKDTAQIFVAGIPANDIGIQSGGWTIEWQGRPGKITDGTTILDAIKATVSGSTTVTYDRFGRFENANDSSDQPITADVGIVVIAEKPYAEGVGDSKDLALSEADSNLIQRVRERSKKLVVILMSGRPMIIAEQLAMTDAYVAAWLPGTEGQGVVDVLFGDKPFTGKLPFTWPRSADQLPFDFKNLGQGCNGPLFPFGYGLDTKSTTIVDGTCE